MERKPYVWQMVKEAVEKCGGKATNAQIRHYIVSKYGNVNENTISCQILTCCVNKESRVNWPENHKPRLANSQYDFLYSTGRGQVELYNPARHGNWEIYSKATGKLSVRQSESSTNPCQQSTEESNMIPAEGRLRDFIVRNLTNQTIGNQKLRIFVDHEGVGGVEYETEVGKIDILTLDEEDNFVVIMLNESVDDDHALANLLRNMGWLKATLSPDRSVKGVLIADTFSANLRYATSLLPEVTLLEYTLQITFSEVAASIHA
ncbi:endonuclease NucS domain-containing protein [Tumebacillus flagellatus]|nr:endonuclease NucS domain-containing protein [Tumebacillus flagellatus]